MKLSIDLLKQKLECVVEHRDQKLRFLANTFGRVVFEKDYDVFDHINRYWASLPMRLQDEIFSVYVEADAAFDLVADTGDVYRALNECVKRLVALHPLDRLQFWLTTDATIMVPDSVTDSPPNPLENMFTSEKTYTRHDYYLLITFSMFLRTMVPIWGQYIETVRKASETNRKEFIAMQLLNDTGLLTTPAVLRLRVYIDETVIKTPSSRNEALGVDDLDHSKVLSGFSSEDISFLYLSLVCVKRLCLADLRGTDHKTQVVATIFKFLAQKTSNQPNNNITIKKENLRETSNDTGKNSILETYRKRSEVSMDDIAELEVAVEDYYGVASRICPDIDINSLEASIASARQLYNKRLTDVQASIASWLIKDQISPKAVYLISKEHLCLLLGTIEAVLLHMGHTYLAAVVTSYAVVGQDEVTVGNISSREQISPNYVVEINKLFPFQWVNYRKGVVIEQPQRVTVAIDQIVDRLTFHAFRTTIDERVVRGLFGDTKRKLVIFSDVKNQLAKLVIDNENRIRNQHA